jgi:hypothetical protein
MIKDSINSIKEKEIYLVSVIEPLSVSNEVVVMIE